MKGWWLVAVLMLAACDSRLRCGPEICREDQLCILPSQERCVPSSPRGTCGTEFRPCVDEEGRDGCFRREFYGACIDVPERCGSPIECTCLEEPVAEALGEPFIYCASVDERGWVIIGF